MQFWLVKTEPETFSWQDLVSAGKTVWDGVRNYQARNYLAQMKKGDLVLVYHSVTQKAIMGIAEVTKESYPDPTSDDPRWLAVDLVPIESFKNPIPLQWIKSQQALQNLPLIRQSRLSVMPLTTEEFHFIVSHSQNSNF
jgi:predicted RNA-binding protein with PUA-like domain